MIDTKPCRACHQPMHRGDLSHSKWARKTTCSQRCRAVAASHSRASITTPTTVRMLEALQHYRLPLTRDEIADELGLASTTIPPSMRSLTARGLVIAYDGPDGLTYRLAEQAAA